MGRVEGKVVVVTGAAGGQGAAEAAALAREGAVVVATDLAEDVPGLPAETDGPGSIAYRRQDVSDAADWRELASWLERTHGRVDGLVNNAGISIRTRLLDVEPDDWQRVLAVNLTGPLLGMQALVPLMGGGSSIVNVSSVSGLTSHFAAAYGTSKWGLRGLSRIATLELGRLGIRVNAIFPGYIETPMTASAPAAFLSVNVEATPLGRPGTVDDVAPLVVYLISDESSFVSGAEIAIDGGLAAHGGVKAMSDAVREAATRETEDG